MDFNARSEDDALYVHSPEIDNMLDLFLQELDILFSIEKNTILGQRSIGHSIEHMLWSTSFNHEFMQSKIHESIQETCFSANYFQWSVEVELLKGTTKDIGVITIHIKNNDNVVIAAPTFVFK